MARRSRGQRLPIRGRIATSIDRRVRGGQMLSILRNSVVLAAVLLTVSTVSASPIVSVGEQTNSQVSATEAAPFIGEWTLALDGPNGPGTFGLSVKLEKDKLEAEVASAPVETSATTNIMKAVKTLDLGY